MLALPQASILTARQDREAEPRFIGATANRGGFQGGGGGGGGHMNPAAFGSPPGNYNTGSRQIFVANVRFCHV
jgi:hypothetical protein